MLLWRLFGGGDGNVSACKEHVVCVLRIWEDEGAVINNSAYMQSGWKADG